MSDYTPKSEEQLAEEGLLAKGEYDFEIEDSSDKKSKAGNTMFTLKMKIFQEDGTGYWLTDYIALGNNFGERKLRHAADSCGVLDIYESGKLLHGDFRGRCGRVKIKVQEGNAEYPLPKNVVDDYVKRTAADTVPAKTTAQTLDDDSIPF